MKRLSLLAALALLLALCLLAVAGAATAGTPTGTPSFTVHAGMAGELDPGTLYPDCPELGNSTQFHWRMWGPAKITWRAPARVQRVYVIYDWSVVALDKPGPGYPDDPESLIPGWHYHWGTGIIYAGAKDPSEYWPKLPPKATWLWTTRFAGTTDPDSWHDVFEYWTGCNRLKGQKALYQWRMLEFNDVNGKGWILD